VLDADADRTDLELRLIGLSLKDRLIDLTACVAILATSVRDSIDAVQLWQNRTTSDVRSAVASLIGRLGSSTFRLSTTAVSMSPTGSRFSSESAPGPFHHGIRGRGGTI
jgi:hypothetical protein